MSDKIFSIIFMVLSFGYIGIDILAGNDQSPMVLGLMVLSKLFSISHEMENA